MTIKTWTVGIAVLALAATPVLAEQSVSDWSYDINVEPVGCDCGDDCCDCGDGCDCGSACGGRGGILGAIEGLSLSSMLGIEGLDIGGWSQFGYHSHTTGLSRVRGDGLAFNDVPHNLNLQQQWFYVGKEADGSRGLDWGFRSDFVYGTDAQKTQAFDNPSNQWDVPWDHGVYGWAIPQLYGEIAVGDFSVIMGHFFTIVGYEVIPAVGNFFYSHSLTMYNSEPFTHTGVLSTYKGFDGMTLYGGWTLGWDTGFANANSGNNFIGGFAIDLLDSVTMTYINTYGNFGARDGGDRNSYSHSLVFNVELTDRLQYIFQTDLVDADDVGVPGTANFIENNQFGINQYLILEWNDLLSFGGRMEWWKNGGDSYYETTGGVNVHVLNNLILRPEYRKDWVPATNYDEDIFGCDMILTY